jgi:nitrilase
LGILLAVGLVEKDARTPGTLYCSLALWDANGVLLNLHRKLKPTASERLIWGEGDGSGLRVMTTKIGKLGGLICWENLMPLARTSLYNQGVELYLAPTADSRETWQATIRHIAMEGRCYVLSCNQFVTKADYPNDLGKASMQELAAAPDPLSRGGSAIISPLGEYLAGPLWDEAGILYATIDPGAITEARFDFDVVGHYSRPDLFQLTGPGAGTSPFDSEAVDDMLAELLFGGAAGLVPPLDDDDDDDFFGPEDADPFFPIFPAAWTEKKPGSPGSTKLPAKPTKRRRRAKS